MDDKPKKRFYKRWWFAFLLGIVVGLLIVFALFLVLIFWNRIIAAPTVRDVRNAAASVGKESVRFSDCVATPSSIILTDSDYGTDNFGELTATLVLINLDAQSHQMGMTGSFGTVTLSPNATMNFPLPASTGQGIAPTTTIMTCDGKDSLSITNLSETQLIDDENAGK